MMKPVQDSEASSSRKRVGEWVGVEPSEGTHVLRGCSSETFIGSLLDSPPPY